MFDDAPRSRYLSELALADLPAALPAAQFLAMGAGAPPDGYVDAGSLVGFTAELTPAHQSDVLNSLLFAQLAASGQHDRQDYDPWSAVYHDVLQNTGWVIQASEDTEYDAGGSAFTVNDVVLEILAGIATPGQLAAITAAIKALKSLADADHRLQLWNRTTHSATSGNFSIAAGSDAGGAVVVKSASFHFETSENVTNVLFFHFNSAKSRLFRSTQTMTLDLGVYDKVRATIEGKLGDRATKYVAGITLAE